jgi:hypothetical protein
MVYLFIDWVIEFGFIGLIDTKLVNFSCNLV